MRAFWIYLFLAAGWDIVAWFFYYAVLANTKAANFWMRLFFWLIVVGLIGGSLELMIRTQVWPFLPQ